MVRAAGGRKEDSDAGVVLVQAMPGSLHLWHHIASEPAPGFHVMDLQTFLGTALLAPPAISFEHPCPDDRISFRI